MPLFHTRTHGNEGNSSIPVSLRGAEWHMVAIAAHVEGSYIYMTALPREFQSRSVQKNIPIWHTGCSSHRAAPRIMSPKSASGPVAAEDLSFGNEKQGLEAPVLTKSDDYAVGITADGEVPTEEEMKTLRRISDKIPFNIYTIAFIELCERFSYYGTTAVFTNFIQCERWNPRLSRFAMH
jgi:hypothetical protein